MTTITDVCKAFNERLLALQCVVVEDAKTRTYETSRYNDLPIVQFEVRPEWRKGVEAGSPPDDLSWSEKVVPDAEFESRTNDAMFWDDGHEFSCPRDGWGYCRLAVDTSRLDTIMAEITKYPIIEDKTRESELEWHRSGI